MFSNDGFVWMIVSFSIVLDMTKYLEGFDSSKYERLFEINLWQYRILHCRGDLKENVCSFKYELSVDNSNQFIAEFLYQDVKKAVLKVFSYLYGKF